MQKLVFCFGWGMVFILPEHPVKQTGGNTAKISLFVGQNAAVGRTSHVVYKRTLSRN